LTCWVTQRVAWSVSPSGELSGSTCSGRSVWGTLPFVAIDRLKKAGVLPLCGGVDHCRYTRKADALDARARAILEWAIRPCREEMVAATLDWIDQSPHASYFGRETLADFGYAPAVRFHALGKSLSDEEWDRARDAYILSQVPIPEWDPVDQYDRMYAA
jgi:hypothetical protein